MIKRGEDDRHQGVILLKIELPKIDRVGQGDG